MRFQTTYKSIVVLALLSGLASLRADVVEVKDGSRLVGTVTKIDAGSVSLDTAYAGKLTIKQSEIVRLETSEPLVVRLAGGTTMAGTISSSADGSLSIKGEDGTINTTVAKLATTWEPGQTDPAVTALEPKWSYEATVDVVGKTGNSESLGTAFGVRATRVSPHEIMQFYSAYNRQESNGTKSADQFKAGFDYANNFSGRTSWYLRDEGGFDRVKDIDLYNVAAVGLGYDFIKETKQKLTGRFGISHRYEAYGNPLTPDLSAAGLDLALIHDYTFENAKMHNELSYVPTFEDFSNYRAKHDSYVEMPLGAGLWKMRFGLSNDYTSQPGAGVERLDTTYYTKLILNWE